MSTFGRRERLAVLLAVLVLGVVAEFALFSLHSSFWIVDFSDLGRPGAISRKEKVEVAVFVVAMVASGTTWIWALDRARAAARHWTLGQIVLIWVGSTAVFLASLSATRSITDADGPWAMLAFALVLTMLAGSAATPFVLTWCWLGRHAAPPVDPGSGHAT